ncbi:MAG TPA: plastocyanin/azurin family copper-binding protein [Gemmatimonadaceae bacterium]|jgi:plastocyanin|nr:plastocyanin/azurin family copper-binding protein [Gemmatimonadaceae bacterium]
MKSRTLVTLAAVLYAAFASGCAKAGPTGLQNYPIPPNGTPNSVVLTNNVFTPGSLSTTVGSTVTWTWNACTSQASGDANGYGTTTECVSHQIVFDDGIGNSPLQDQGHSTRTFTAAGTFPYHCAIHGAVMSGQVVVQ